MKVGRLLRLSSVNHWSERGEHVHFRDKKDV